MVLELSLSKFLSLGNFFKNSAAFFFYTGGLSSMVDSSVGNHLPLLLPHLDDRFLCVGEGLG